MVLEKTLESPLENKEIVFSYAFVFLHNSSHQSYGFSSSHVWVLEKEMATHSSVLAWRIPGMAEPGGLPSVGSHRVGHD